MVGVQRTSRTQGTCGLHELMHSGVFSIGPDFSAACATRRAPLEPSDAPTVLPTVAAPFCPHSIAVATPLCPYGVAYRSKPPRSLRFHLPLHGQLAERLTRRFPRSRLAPFKVTLVQNLPMPRGFGIRFDLFRENYEGAYSILPCQRDNRVFMADRNQHAHTLFPSVKF